MIGWQRIRMFMAMLAVFGALWVAVDMHQHESGLHQQAACSLCLLEDAVAHGFTPQQDSSVVQASLPEAVVYHLSGAVLRPGRHPHSIRAPPVV